MVQWSPSINKQDINYTPSLCHEQFYLRNSQSAVAFVISVCNGQVGI